MIEKIVPRGVAAADSFVDDPSAKLHPLEASLVSRTVPKRTAEIVAARHCGRIAMRQLGFGDEPILRGERGEPLWPDGLVGSLTHCDGYRAAVVGFGVAFRSLGIDAEPHLPLPDRVLPSVSIEPERDVISARLSAAGNKLCWDRLLFCAKEATYKAWYPLTRRWLGFEDAHITFTQLTDISGEFVSKILIDGKCLDGGNSLREMHGKWLVADSFIVTSVVVK